MYVLIDVFRERIMMYLNAFSALWMYERDAFVGHMIRFHLSFHTRPFHIVPVWAENIQAGLLPFFSDCRSETIHYDCDKHDGIQGIDILNSLKVMYEYMGS
jgi:hypothetical protein